MAEFTGERVVPGLVDIDLWNEHYARYQFALRLCRGRRVLDLGCGTGYGASEMASLAHHVVGVDFSSDAVGYAQANYDGPNRTFVQASATAIPFRDGSFDLITSFELIEHLSDWATLLSEARRVLAPTGQFLVSTPNKKYYAETRAAAGPNPFHEHEFTLDEFREALAAVFPSVSLFVQNHTDSFVFEPLNGRPAAEVRVHKKSNDPDAAHFFLAVCAQVPQVGAPTFVFLPATGNVLRERELHIERLQRELAQKDAWLDKALADHKALADTHESQRLELEARNRWALELNQQLADAMARIDQLQSELAAEQAAARDTVAGYEAKLAELDADIRAKTEWALETDRRLSAELEQKSRELAECVRLLQAAEQTVDERTRWALDLEQNREKLTNKLSMVEASRWYRMGRRFGLGPEVRDN